MAFKLLLVASAERFVLTYLTVEGGVPVCVQLVTIAADPPVTMIEKG